MDLEDRVGTHAGAMGTTRVGKTRLAELLIAWDIRRGEVVVVFDPRGDVVCCAARVAEAERAGRGGEFFMFHLGHRTSRRATTRWAASRASPRSPPASRPVAVEGPVRRVQGVRLALRERDGAGARGARPQARLPEITYASVNVEPLLIDYLSTGSTGSSRRRAGARSCGRWPSTRKSRQGSAVARGLRSASWNTHGARSSTTRSPARSPRRSTTRRATSTSWWRRCCHDEKSPRGDRVAAVAGPTIPATGVRCSTGRLINLGRHRLRWARLASPTTRSLGGGAN